MADGKFLEIRIHPSLPLWIKAILQGSSLNPGITGMWERKLPKKSMIRDITLEEYLGAEPVGSSEAIESDSEDSSTRIKKNRS